MCLYPRLLLNKKYVANKKNAGKIPELKDIRTKYVAVSCGECLECHKKKARNWTVRLKEEIKNNNTGVFVTLTFNEDKLNYYYNRNCDAPLECIDNEVAIDAIRHFLESWRKKYKKSVKHWLITELGHTGTERIHIHGIIFTDKITEIEKIWNNGYVYTGYSMNEAVINYCVKYMLKKDLDHKWFKPKILCSPGIGANYIKSEDAKLNKFNGKKTREAYIQNNGSKIALPTYYRNKLYTEEEREMLWINQLNKNEIVVGGEVLPIKTDKDYEIYENIREHYRKLSKLLGYDEPTFDEKLYKKRNRKINDKNH